MSPKGPPKIAVVGRNIDAGLWLASAVENGPGGRWAWYQTELERHRRRQSFRHGVWMPRSLLASLPGSDHFVTPLAEPALFLGRAHRYPLSQFVGPTGALRGPPIAVRRRLQALGLWGDPTPSLWKGAGRSKHPDPSWTQRMPVSFDSDWLTLPQLVFVDREAVLLALESFLRDRGVDIGVDDDAVQGVEESRTSEGALNLVHNAPFGITPFDRVLWTSALKPPKLGAAKTSSSATFATHWRSWGTQVPSNELTGLPKASLWIDPKETPRFFETGLLASSALKRVVALLLPEEQGHRQAWLQIDELVMADASSGPEHPAPDLSFLGELCPTLCRRRDLAWDCDVLDETLVADDAQEVLVEIAPQIDLWRRSAAGRPTVSAPQWIRRRLPRMVQRPHESRT